MDHRRPRPCVCFTPALNVAGCAGQRAHASAAPTSVSPKCRLWEPFHRSVIFRDFETAAPRPTTGRSPRSHGERSGREIALFLEAG